jgi:hypothetical protein
MRAEGSPDRRCSNGERLSHPPRVLRLLRPISLAGSGAGGRGRLVRWQGWGPSQIQGDLDELLPGDLAPGVSRPDELKGRVTRPRPGGRRPCRGRRRAGVSSPGHPQHHPDDERRDHHQEQQRDQPRDDRRPSAVEYPTGEGWAKVAHLTLLPSRRNGPTPGPLPRRIPLGAWIAIGRSREGQNHSRGIRLRSPNRHLDRSVLDPPRAARDAERATGRSDHHDDPNRHAHGASRHDGLLPSTRSHSQGR